MDIQFPLLKILLRNWVLECINYAYGLLQCQKHEVCRKNIVKKAESFRSNNNNIFFWAINNLQEHSLLTQITETKRLAIIV